MKWSCLCEITAKLYFIGDLNGHVSATGHKDKHKAMWNGKCHNRFHNTMKSGDGFSSEWNNK